VQSPTLTVPLAFPLLVLCRYHSGGWGGWQFPVASQLKDNSLMFKCRQLTDDKVVPCPQTPDPANPVVVLGGNQECRGAQIGKNPFYIENVEEELDVEREWFRRAAAGGGGDSTPTLLYFPGNGTDLATASVVGAVLQNVIEVK
jgi:hypothetical protein